MMIVGALMLYRNLSYLVLPLMMLGGCEDKSSPYLLGCRSADDRVVINDDTLMHMSSKAIYDHLKDQGKLEQLPGDASPHTLYHMYRSPKDYLKLDVSRRGPWWNDPPRTFIYVTYETKETTENNTKDEGDNLISFIVDYQDCGPLEVN